MAKKSEVLRLTEKSKLTNHVLDYFWNCSDEEFPKFLDSVPPRKLWRLSMYAQHEIGGSLFENDPLLILIRLPRFEALVRRWVEVEKDVIVAVKYR